MCQLLLIDKNPVLHIHIEVMGQEVLPLKRYVWFGNTFKVWRAARFFFPLVDAVLIKLYETLKKYEEAYAIHSSVMNKKNQM